MKAKIAGAIAAGVFLFAGVASAATIPNIQFSNGQTSTSCIAGQSVNVTFRVNIPSNEVVELGQVDVIGDTLAPALPSSLGGDLGLQEGPQDVQMSFTCPQNTGYYSVQFSTAGIFGGQRAVTMTDGVTSTATFSNAIRVVANGSTSGTSGAPAGVDPLVWAKFIAYINAQGSTPAPATDAQCAAFAAANVGSQPNVYNSGNIALQGYLLSQHMSIPALTSGGASFGFYGNQTTAAIGQWRSMHPSCI